MKSLILSTATRILMPLILPLSVFVFYRGHNEPGGGFIGGLLAATAFALLEKAEGLAAARRALRFRPSHRRGRPRLRAGLGPLGRARYGYFLKGVWPFYASTRRARSTGCRSARSRSSTSASISWCSARSAPSSSRSRKWWRPKRTGGTEPWRSCSPS